MQAAVSRIFKINIVAALESDEIVRVFPDPAQSPGQS